MEETMGKSLITIATAVAMLSLGSLASQAGNGAQGISKYSNQTTANHYAITEFSSSSAKSSVSHR
jgi:hypothetical protein